MKINKYTELENSVKEMFENTEDDSKKAEFIDTLLWIYKVC